ncbi:hypothetical protein AB0383_20195 [Amycolatopsis sp. NPDC051373]|uniref:hypothetical protein n=1 Tax=Amycolatopsis sp. NPDC051373 TaxID=3155801 RepID=UPI00344C2929
MTDNELDRAVNEAREMKNSAENSTDAETMAVYEEIGELLKTGRTDDDYVAEVQELAGRLVELHKIADVEDLERAALRTAMHPIPWIGGMAA